MQIPVTRYAIMTFVMFVFISLPLMILGCIWLWDNEYLYQFIGIVSALVALFYCLTHWRNSKGKSLFIEAITVEPDPNWSDKSKLVFQEIKALAERRQVEPDLFTDTSKLLDLTNEVLTLVAKEFHVHSKYPVLHFPLPVLLKLIVSVCDDIQHKILDNIPGSHALPVGDLLRIKNAVDSFNNMKSIYTVGQWLVNWPGAALTSARGILLQKGVGIVTDEISKRMVSVYIQQLGAYAIQLYGGQLYLDDAKPIGRLSVTSAADMDESQKRDQSVEPLRFLVLGQISSGKSSLINAMFGELKSAAGLLPTTQGITPYVLKRDGLPTAIISDIAGYDGFENSSCFSNQLKGQLAKTDVILLVCNTAQASRNADVQHLDAIRNYFQQECPNQRLPVIIAVATNIDLLRPKREWQPPYQIQQPNCDKARNIRQACLAIAEELTLEPDCIVPVCLDPEKTAYNIENGLIPLIHEHLDSASRVRYLRCLRQQQSENYWQQWYKQTAKSGQLFIAGVNRCVGN